MIFRFAPSRVSAAVRLVSSMGRGLVASLLASLFILTSFFVAPVVNASPSGTTNIVTPSAYDWPMFQHDASHSGSTVSPAPLTNKQIATGSVGGEVKTS